MIYKTREAELYKSCLIYNIIMSQNSPKCSLFITSLHLKNDRGYMC